MGKRSLAVAVFAVLVLLHTIYTFSTPKSSSTPPPPSTHFQDDEAPTISPDSGATLPSPPSPLVDSVPPQPSSCAVTKVSMLYGAHKFAQLEAALESHRRHSQRWGCGFESLEHDLTGRKLYSKHYFLLSTMLHELSKPAEDRQQWLMWVDADSILINPAISPCAFLPPDNLHDVFALVTADHQGLNNGVFYLRVHPSSLDLLTQMVDYPLAHPDEDLGWFGEQAAMEHVIHSTEKRFKEQRTPSGIAWVPRFWFNTFEFEHGYEGEPGHFMVHFAGLAETRIQHMANWLTELQNNQVKWEIPLEKTFYADAVPRYWDAFAVNATKHT